MELVPFGVCQNCKKKMKVIMPETTPSVISKMRVCVNPQCIKHDTYRTYEIHEARYLLLLNTEQKQGKPPPNRPVSYTLPDSVFEQPTPVVEHSFERALTPVEPADPLANDPLASETAQNKAYKVIKAKLDSGEMSTEDYDKAMRVIFGD